VSGKKSQGAFFSARGDIGQERLNNQVSFSLLKENPKLIKGGTKRETEEEISYEIS
jgi:hypothetical protein